MLKNLNSYPSCNFCLFHEKTTFFWRRHTIKKKRNFHLFTQIEVSSLSFSLFHACETLFYFASDSDHLEHLSLLQLLFEARKNSYPGREHTNFQNNYFSMFEQKRHFKLDFQPWTLDKNQNKFHGRVPVNMQTNVHNNTLIIDKWDVKK